MLKKQSKIVFTCTKVGLSYPVRKSYYLVGSSGEVFPTISNNRDENAMLLLLPYY